MSKGDISCLTLNVGRKHKFENGGKVRSTAFYGRDSGDKRTETKSWAIIDQVLKPQITAARKTSTSTTAARGRG